MKPRRLTRRAALAVALAAILLGAPCFAQKPDGLVDPAPARMRPSDAPIVAASAPGQVAADPAEPAPAQPAISLEAVAARPDAAWEDANAAYASGDFAKARALYLALERVVAREPRVELWRNLGTTFARLGDPVQAALRFRRVLAAHPGDPAARENLKILGLPESPDGRAGQLDVLRPLLDPVARLLPAAAWFYGALVLWLATTALNGARRRGGRQARSGQLVWTLAGLALVASLVAAWSWHARRAFASGTVARDVRARSGPGETFPEIYDLKAGTPVWLPDLDAPNGHAKVFLPTDKPGYVPRDAVEPHRVAAE